MGLDDLPMPPEQLSEAARLFYDGGYSMADKRAKLIERAESGDAEARGYLESLNRIERGPASPIEELLNEFALALSVLIPQRSREKGLQKINERDQLQPWSAEVLRGLAETRPQVSVATSVSVDYPANWPRLGDVDISLTDSDSHAFLELKCGSSRDALSFCAWDLLKLALLLRVEECSEGYLVAASPQPAWSEPIRGAEFFSESEWRANDVRGRYEDWFRTWEKEMYRPTRIPTTGRTQFVTAVEFDIAGALWELRIARVQTDANEWVDWQPLLDQN